MNYSDILSDSCKDKMSNNKCEYEYLDETSINPELLCTICNKPFVNPVSTPCDHTFCCGCIQRWIEKNNQSCPTCRRQIQSIDQCTQVSRPLRNILDRLQIKCLICNQTGLQRDHFNDHMNKVCPKMNVSCPAVDIKCPWTGLREELEKHLTTCKFEPLRSLLNQLLTENRQLDIEKQQLTDKIKQQNIQMNESSYKLSTINNGKKKKEKRIILAI
jgi:hypothetical protein